MKNTMVLKIKFLFQIWVRIAGVVLLNPHRVILAVLAFIFGLTRILLGYVSAVAGVVEDWFVDLLKSDDVPLFFEGWLDQAQDIVRKKNERS